MSGCGSSDGLNAGNESTSGHGSPSGGKLGFAVGVAVTMSTSDSARVGVRIEGLIRRYELLPTVGTLQLHERIK